MDDLFYFLQDCFLGLIECFLCFGELLDTLHYFDPCSSMLFRMLQGKTTLSDINRIGPVFAHLNSRTAANVGLTSFVRNSRPYCAGVLKPHSLHVSRLPVRDRRVVLLLSGASACALRSNHFQGSRTVVESRMDMRQRRFECALRMADSSSP